MTTYHLLVVRGRESRPRSIARFTAEADQPVAAARAAAGPWVQEHIAGLNVTRWWVVAAETADDARDLVAELLSYYTPKLPPIPAGIKQRVLALGRG